MIDSATIQCLSPVCLLKLAELSHQIMVATARYFPRIPTTEYKRGINLMARLLSEEERKMASAFRMIIQDVSRPVAATT